MSYRYFFDSIRIDELPGGLDGLAEIRVLNGGGNYQIHGAVKQCLQIFEQAEVGVGVLIEVQLLESHQEVQIAVRGVEVQSGGGPEKLDTGHPAVAATGLQ